MPGTGSSQGSADFSSRPRKDTARSTDQEVSSARKTSSKVPLRRSVRIASLQASQFGAAGEQLTEQNSHTQHDLTPRAEEAERARDRQRQKSRQARASEEQAAISGNQDSTKLDELETLEGVVDAGILTGEPKEGSSVKTQYQLEMMVQPPARARPNVPLYPPTIVKLFSKKGEDEDHATVDDLMQLWGFASLTDEDGTIVLSPPSSLLSGVLVDSAHRLPPTLLGSERDDLEDGRDGVPSVDDRAVGYLMFPGLTITEKGKYRIRITVVRMRSSGSSSSPTSPQGAMSIRRVESRMVEVSDSAEPEPVGLTEQKVLDMLREAGIEIPLPS